MQGKGRSVPPDEERGPRNKAMSIYLSEEEHKLLEEYALAFGFPSKSQMVVYIVENAMKGGFSGLTFSRIGSNFSKMIEESGIGYLDIPMPKFMRDRRDAKLKKKKADLIARRKKELEGQEGSDAE